jgi:heme/copper-type cytochrome/quinol oxidase subunit 2
MVGIILISFVIYGLGALTIHLFSKAADTESQKEHWNKSLKNPILCLLWGIPSPILLFFAFFDWALNLHGTGYYDGRED